MSDSGHRSFKNRDVIVIDDDESATEKDAVPTPPISSQELIELREKLNKAERQLQKACRITREAELRAERAENLLDSKRGILDVVKKERDDDFERRLADISEQLEEIKRKEITANELNNEMMRRVAAIKSESNELRIDAEMEGRSTPSLNESSTDTPVQKVNIRPVRSVSRPMRYIDSHENSDGDRKLSTKKSKSEARPRLRKPSILEWKRSDTEMQCHECEFHTRIVRTWDWHIREIHNTTPSVAGVFLRCECGYEGMSHKHILVCKLANFIVVGKDGEPIRRSNAKEGSIDNAMEEVNIRPMRSNTRPKRYIDYYEESDEDYESPASLTILEEDVKKINKDSPMVDRGRKRKIVVSHPNDDTDTKKARLAIHRSDTESECPESETIPQTPRCVLCEKYPKTTRGYTDHLQNYHHSTLSQNRIYLTCSCGLEVLSGWQRLHMHREMCDGSKFTLHSLDTN